LESFLNLITNRLLNNLTTVGALKGLVSQDDHILKLYNLLKEHRTLQAFNIARDLFRVSDGFDQLS